MPYSLPLPASASSLSSAPLSAAASRSTGCYIGICPSLFSKFKGQGATLASTILWALLPQIPLQVPVCLMVADWIEGYSLALFQYNSLSSGQARALRDGDQIVQHMNAALAAFPETQRQRVKLVRWKEMVDADPSYQEQTAAVQAFLRSDEGRQANQILEDMALRFVQARQGPRTLKEERIKYAEAYLQAEVVGLMRGLHGADTLHQPCHYGTHYHPVLATQQDAESVSIRNFQEVFRHILSSQAWKGLGKPTALARNYDLELEPKEDGTLSTHIRAWSP